MIDEILVQIAEAVAAAIFMATVANRLVEGLIKPLFEKFELDKFWLMYISWGVGGLLVWFSGINLFSPFMPDAAPIIGKILSAIVAGGGANLISDIFVKPKFPEPIELVAGVIDETED